MTPVPGRQPGAVEASLTPSTRPTREPLQIRNGQISVPSRPGLGVDIDLDRVRAGHELYLEKALGGRDDTIAMQYLIPGWTFANEKPALVR